MASRSLGTLTIDMVAKVGGWVDGMNKAERRTDQATRAMLKRKRELEREWKKVGGLVAAGFGLILGGSLAASFRNTTRELAELATQAQKVGMQADVFSGYAAAAKQADVSSENLTRTLQRLAMATAGGSDQFERLGIDQKSLKGTEDALRKVADAFAKMPDGAQKVDAARRLMGRAGAEMIGLLNQGSEGIDRVIEQQRKLGNVIGGETFATMAEYKKVMDDMTAAMTGFRRQIGIALLPALTAMAKVFAEDLAPAADGAKGAVLDWGETTGRVIAFTADSARSGLFSIAKGFEVVGRTIGAAMAQAKMLLSGNVAGVGRVGQEWLADMQRINKEVQSFDASAVRKAFEQLRSGAGSSSHAGSVMPTSIGGGASGKVQRDPVLEAGKQYIEQLQRQIALGEKATEVEKVLYELRHGRLVGLNAGMAGQLTDLAKQIDAMREQKALAEALESVNIRTLEMQGKLGAAAAARFDKENEGIRKVLEAAGETGALAQLDQLRDQEVAQARINKLMGEYQQITATLQIQEERIAISQQVGALGELEALQRIGEERQQAIAQIRAQLALFDAMNEAALTDTQRLQIEQLRLELEKLESVADPLADKFNTVIKDSFSGAFADFITGTKSAKEAFRSFAQSIMQQMAQLIAQQAAMKLFGGGIFAGLGGLFPSFDVGTPYVPRDTLAMVHKGERILTADENRDFMKGGDTKIINVMDPSVVGDYLGTDAGESLIINVMQRNRQLIGV